MESIWLDTVTEIFYACFQMTYCVSDIELQYELLSILIKHQFHTCH